MKGITGNPVLDAYQRGGVSKVGAAKPAEQAAPAAPSTGGGPSSAAVEVSISPAARDLAAHSGQPINHAKVEDVKNKISQGTFHIDSKAIAERLLSALG
jgi:negative regulator of flagellin synthesis FlgM